MAATPEDAKWILTGRANQLNLDHVSERNLPGQDTSAAARRRELEKGLESGVSKRSPEQIRADFRKAREAA